MNYNFAATITDMVVQDRATGVYTYVSSSNVPGVLVSNGNHLSGQFAYDTSVPLSESYQPTQPANGSYLVYENPYSWLPVKHDWTMSTSFSISDNGLTYTSNADPFLSLIQVADNNNGSDFFAFHTINSSIPDFFQSTNIFLDDVYGTVFASAAIPSELHLNEFQYSSFSYSILTPDTWFNFNAKLDGLTRVDVPEPSDIGIMLIGLAALVFAARRKTIAGRFA